MHGALVRRMLYCLHTAAALRESTPVEVAWGHDMTVSDWLGVPIQRWSTQESPDFSHGERPSIPSRLVSRRQPRLPR